MIIGKRVRLRAMEKGDLSAFVRWFNDPEIRRNLDMVQPLSMGQEEKWYADMLNCPVDEHPRIYLRVFETNPRGKRCYEKAGFSVDGCLRQARFLEGKYVDVFIMSILKSEWKIENNIGGNE